MTSDISPGPHGWGVTVLAGPAGRVDVKVLGRSRVHVCALAGGFLQGLAYGMPLTIAGHPDELTAGELVSQG